MWCKLRSTVRKIHNKLKIMCEFLEIINFPMHRTIWFPHAYTHMYLHAYSYLCIYELLSTIFRDIALGIANQLLCQANPNLSLSPYTNQIPKQFFIIMIFIIYNYFTSLIVSSYRFSNWRCLCMLAGMLELCSKSSANFVFLKKVFIYSWISRGDKIDIHE